MISIFSVGQDFLSAQLKHVRVSEAWKAESSSIKSKFKAAGVSSANFYLFLRAFKQEKQIEAWVSSSPDGPFKLIANYDVCAASGGLGPKIKQGDLQVPEGVYSIDRFNPISSFHLSFGIDYPNTADLKRSAKANPGGDIFIHGACASIGCLAITDQYINELYLIAVLARSSGQSKIPVHIFPFRMDGNAMQLVDRIQSSNQWKPFWENLANVYRFFEEQSKPGVWKSNTSGKYILSN
jgi:murein L,D-transpeptidase YafK